MTETVPIALTQLVLWYDSTRIQAWPAIMAEADAGTVYPSTREFGKTHCTDRITTRGHSAADNVSKNLPGLETKGSRLVLRGIGLLEKTTGGYRISESGRELGASYRKDPSGKAWGRLLGRLLLQREPRTRILMKLLSENGASLYFTEEQWWGGSIGRATINFEDGRQFIPFLDTHEQVPNLRTAIKEHPWWALGEWRTHPLLNGADDCSFVGLASADFSLHAVSVALRASCEVLLFLGALHHKGDRCWLDHNAAIAAFGPAVAEDFGWESAGEKKSLREWLGVFANELRLDTGFLVASELRDRLRKQGFENPDRDIAQLESEGRVIIEAADYGQSRHGIGLYDDPSKQLIKLRVC